MKRNIFLTLLVLGLTVFIFKNNIAQLFTINPGAIILLSLVFIWFVVSLRRKYLGLKNHFFPPLNNNTLLELKRMYFEK